MTEVILASGSPRRTQLLSQIGVTHRVIVPALDESVYANLPPEEMVRTLALQKAMSVCSRAPVGLIVGSDTIVVIDGHVLGKPATATDACAMLTHLSGREHFVYTGIAVVDARSGKYRSGCTQVAVRMRLISSDEIACYVQTGEPMDKAGAYSIQGRGAVFIEAICGDFYSVVGLPLAMTAEFLAHFGVNSLIS